jgi:hypothetical protein
MRGFGELIDDVVKAVRKSDPPTATQAAAIAAHERNRRDPREEMLARIERIASRLEAIVPLPAPAPVPPHEPLPPGAPPPPKLVYTKQQGWHIPSTLTREELASTVPSAEDSSSSSPCCRSANRAGIPREGAGLPKAKRRPGSVQAVLQHRAWQTDLYTTKT